MVVAVSTLLVFVPVSVEASPVRYDAYGQVLTQFVEQGQVDYASLKKNRKDLDHFVSMLGELSREPYETFNEQEKIAFWLNAYNAITLKVIIDHYPINKKRSFAGLPFPKKSIRQIRGAWDKIAHPVFGEPVTLDAIEHKILRQDFNEPRIHMALVCAARGCPPLRSEPYLGSRLDEQLDDQARQFLASEDKFKLNQKERVLHLSAIFDWFGKDFVERYGTDQIHLPTDPSEKAVLHFIQGYLRPEEAQFVKNETYNVLYYKYDWTLNDRVPVGKTA